MSYKHCICGSKEHYKQCCSYFIEEFNAYDGIEISRSDSLLIGWQNRYSWSSTNSFRSKTRKHVFRMSVYLDSFFKLYYPFGYIGASLKKHELDDSIISIKHNILMGLFGALSCIEQGLFLQSGTLLRSCLEDCFVLMDISLNDKESIKFINDKYSTNGLLSRVKNHIPKFLLDWYGYFSANFTHFGPFHRAPYKPTACHANNYVVGSGIENILLVCSGLHIILERIYFQEVTSPRFWRVDSSGAIGFDNENRLLEIIYKAREQLIVDFPPDEIKEGFRYHEKSYRPKC